MTTRRFHASLTSSEFPHNFAELGSTIVAPNVYENNRMQAPGFNGQEAEQSFGICQAYFMQNVLPTARGYSAVSYRRMLPPIAGVTEIPELNILRGTGQNVAMHAAVIDTQYVYDPRVGTWQAFPLGTLTIIQPYVATVKSRTFVFYPELSKVFEYDFDAQAMVEVTIAGLDLLQIDGFCAAGAYLVAWNASQVFWSSVFDPVDFVPSLATGAGSTSVLAVKSKIIMCASIADGFMMYTATNAVSARQTANVQFPFLFKEVPGSAGIASRNHVASNGNRPLHFTWTASGFQQVSLDGAEYAFPDLSDGVIRGILSELDPLYLRPVLNRYSNLDVRISFASNRWLVISLRTAVDAVDDVPYRLAYVFDTLLNRWGRLDISHRQVIEFSSPEFYQAYTYQDLADNYPTYEDMVGVPYVDFLRREKIAAPQPNENFGVVLAAGAVYRAALTESNDFETGEVIPLGAEPRLYLGKFKVFRNQGAKFHNARMAGIFGATIRTHGHGQDGQYVASSANLVEHPRQPGTFYGRMNANAFSLELTGQFHLTDLVIEATDAGMRNQRFSTADTDVAAVYVGDSPVYAGPNQVVVEAP